MEESQRGVQNAVHVGVTEERTSSLVARLEAHGTRDALGGILSLPRGLDTGSSRGRKREVMVLAVGNGWTGLVSVAATTASGEIGRDCRLLLQPITQARLPETG